MRLCLRVYILKSAFSILRTFQYHSVDDSLKKRFSFSKKVFFKHKWVDLANFENSYSSNEKALFTCKSLKGMLDKFWSDTNHLRSIFHPSEHAETSFKKKRFWFYEKMSIFFSLFVKNRSFEGRKALFCKLSYTLNYTSQIRNLHTLSFP